MTELALFGDETGDMEFAIGPNISRYFMVCTVCPHSPGIGAGLLKLKRQLLWDDMATHAELHASKDHPAVRERVLAYLAGQDFRADVTIFEKRKAMPKVRPTWERFYKYAWYYHLRHVIPILATPKHKRVTVIVSSIGLKKRRKAMLESMNDVVQQVSTHPEWRVGFWPAQSDPCLVVADYCAWAVQRHWESGDSVPRKTIEDRIATEYDIWRYGPVAYY